MISKIFPRKLNHSSDSKVRGKDDMFDAINISVTEDNRDGGGSLGTIKSIRSNSLIDGETAFVNDATKVVLGKIADDKYHVLYFFVYCTDPNEQGVYAYDPTGYFPDHAPEEVVAIHKSAEYNFQVESFIKGDVTYIQRKFETEDRVYEDTPILFFTDNVNEPRKLSVLRAFNDVSIENYALGSPEIKDFITACPKAPVRPITFEFLADEDLPYSEFRNINGFQFAYQAVFKDGNVSAMSTFSEIAVPPSYVTQGSLETINLNQHNICRLSIPIADMSEETDKVKILARRGNDGEFFEIEEKNYTPTTIPEQLDFNQGIISFDFRNDSVNIAIPSGDQIKQFDNLPKRSEAQCIVGDRLFYGNYVEGFDPVDVSAIINPITRERSKDFTNYEIKVLPATCLSESLTADGGWEDFNVGSNLIDSRFNKNAAFVLDPSDIPQSGVDDGDIINFSFTIKPDQNWHIYDSASGYHQHAQLGDYFGLEEVTPPTEYINPQFSSALGSNRSVFFQPVDYDFPTSGFVPAVCEDGVQGNKIWKDITGNNKAPVFGSSAGNPLIVSGGEISVSLRLQSNDNNPREAITEYMTHVITGAPLDESVVLASAFTVLPETNINASYEFDLELENGDLINQAGPSAQLITMIGAGQTAGLEGRMAGCFLINKAKVELGFFKDEPYHETLNLIGQGSIAGEGSGWDNDDDEPYKRRIGLYVKRITDLDSEPMEILTCVRRKAVNSPWLLRNNSPTSVSTPSLAAMPVGPFEDTLEDINIDPNAAFEAGGDFEFFLGYLDFPEVGDFFFGEDENGKSKFSLMDGQGGPAGGPARADGGFEYDEVGVPIGPATQGIFLSLLIGMENYGSAALTFGASLGQPFKSAGVPTGTILDNNILISSVGETLPLWTGNGPHEPFTQGIDILEEGEGDGTVQEGTTILLNSSLHLFLAHSAPKSLDVTLYVALAADEGLKSFKSGANHAFGVVYYDQRGRASNVHLLGSALAPAYYDRTNNQYGKVEMQLTLNHEPPPYAESFQIVYAGNTSISDFIQYTTAAAFISTDEASLDQGNIYVSLNYLQKNPDISYVHAFGARSPEGARDMYAFKEGDILRVISHYFDGDPEDGRAFLSDTYDFEVVDYVELGGGTDNPLYDIDADGSVPHIAKQGAFVVLKNNPAADGFTFEDVRLGNNEINAQSHNWGKRAVVEIFAPANVQAEENLLFYETSKVFSVEQHAETILLTGGDVWWRKVAVNMPKFEDGIFKSLIGNPTSVGGAGAERGFKSYSLETKAFNDTVRRANVTDIGKIKIVAPNSQESFRSSSITYSDKNKPASSTFTLTSFNPAKFQFKDIPAKYGNINYLVDQFDSVFVIQANKCSAIPIDRNIITDAAGSESLIAASQVIGTEKYYAGMYGCDNNPESVCVVGDSIYFASKSREQIYRFNLASGIEVISDKGMKAFFRNLFENVIAAEANGEGVVKIVGGYDPLKDEFLISVYNQSLTNAIGIEGGTPQGFLSADLNQDGSVNTEDLLTLLTTLGTSGEGLAGDFNNDGFVSNQDLVEFLAAYSEQIDSPE